MIYNVIFGISALLNILTFNERRSKFALYWVLLVFYFLFATFRWEVGCDWPTYREHAELYGPMSFAEAMAFREFGYWTLVVLLDRLGLNYPFINVVAGIIFFGGLHMIARRQPDPLIFVTLLFPIFVTGVIMALTRQAIAIGFLCLAYNALCDRKLLRFILCILVGATFHASAVVFIVLAPFVKTEVTPQQIAIGVILSLPALYYLASGDLLASYTESYVGTAYDAAGAPFRTALTALTGIVFYLFLRKQWVAYSPHDYNLVFLVAPAMLLVFPLSFFSTVIADRFAYYLTPVQTIILAKSYLFYRGSRSYFFFLFPMATLGGALFFWSQYSGLFALCYANYQIWW